MSYGSLNLTVTSPIQSLTEVLSSATVKAYLNLPERWPPDPAEDAQIAALITAAREQAEILQNRDLVRKQWDLSLDGFPATDYIELRDPLVTVDLFRYRDSDGTYTTLTEGVEYIVDTAKHPGRAVLAYNESWPSFTAWPSSAVLVRFTSGFSLTDPFWSDAGARVKEGMKKLISDWFSNRLPFEIGASAIQEYPYAVTACLSYGAVPRVR